MGMGIVGGLFLGALGGGILGYVIGHATPAQASTKPPGGGPTPPSPATWKRATTIPAGARVRLSIAAGDLTQYEKTFGLMPGFDGLKQLLQSPPLQQLFGVQTFTAWGPTDALPSDWPKDDPTATSDPATAGYHVEFVNGPSAWSTQPQPGLPPIPIPVLAWTAS